MEERKGYISHIIFRNAENGYTVFELDDGNGEIETCVGNFPFINEGEYVHLQGQLVQHPVYMEQFKVTSFQVEEPEDAIAMLRYLASGAIKGIRGGLAKRIVDKFQEKTFEIIEKEPERLAEIKGISEKKAREIGIQFEEKKEMRSAIIFLQNYGISNQLAVKIYKRYGIELYNIIKENPYKLAEDIKGVGFKIADEIARKAGFAMNSEFRIRTGILYVMNNMIGEGYVYIPYMQFLKETVEKLGVMVDEVEAVVQTMFDDKTLIFEKKEDEDSRVYLPVLYYSELNSARMLLDLNINFGRGEKYNNFISSLEKREKIELDGQQKIAVTEAMTNGVLVITGGPGTGKTTTINMIIKGLREQGMDILLAAPTGRAAKRMSEATGYEAQTIHRLLEYNGSLENDEDLDKDDLFGRNEWNPLETDVVVIDEMSMVDIFLFYNLLRAISVGTRIILVGDINQLPSVGPGNVLKDIIDSHSFPVVKLTKIFRQAAQSDIVVNAHRINDGMEISLDNKSKDFFCLERDNVHEVLHNMLWLVRDYLPKYTKCTSYDVQVLVPMKKGEVGVYKCNEILQKYLNPEDSKKNQLEVQDVIFREGDKVMQIKNNYQIKWEMRGYNNMVINEGQGVFNGDCGVIVDINTFDKEITVKFDDEKYVTYQQGSFVELELAYAITIHKSQGSEYPAVVLPLFDGPRPLMNRNILYTAVTRGKKCVIIVGKKSAVIKMIENKYEQVRYSSLDERVNDLQN